METAKAGFRPTFPTAPFADPAVQDLREAARERFEELGLPGRREEDWRFINLGAVRTTSYRPGDRARFDVSPWKLSDGPTLVFVNGRLDRELSDLEDLPEGLTVGSLAEALADPATGASAHVGSMAHYGNQPFVALNTAQELEGAFIHVAAGTRADAPIHVVSAAVGDHTTAYPRTLIMAEEGARAHVVETFISEGRTFSCPVTEVAVAAKAEVRHTRLQEEHTTASHLGTVAAALESEASYHLSSLSLGAALARVDVSVKLMGSGAHASLDGLALVSGTRQGDHQVRIDHAVPECTSNQRFRSVLDDASRSVFTGRIVVAEGAHGTDANQSSKSLVRSDDAVAFNNPQLEIYNDDVRCTHGSTVGRLDEEALFYLRARGLDLEAARGLLTLAFAAEVLDAIGEESIRDRVGSLLTSRLGPERDR